MLYRYYIVTIDDGTVYGTNDKDKANSYSESEEMWVIDAIKGTWIIDNTPQDIEELP